MKNRKVLESRHNRNIKNCKKNVSKSFEKYNFYLKQQFFAHFSNNLLFYLFSWLIVYFVTFNILIPGSILPFAYYYIFLICSFNFHRLVLLVPKPFMTNYLFLELFQFHCIYHLPFSTVYLIFSSTHVQVITKLGHPVLFMYYLAICTLCYYRTTKPKNPVPTQLEIYTHFNTKLRVEFKDCLCRSTTRSRFRRTRGTYCSTLPARSPTIWAITTRRARGLCSSTTLSSGPSARRKKTSHTAPANSISGRGQLLSDTHNVCYANMLQIPVLYSFLIYYPFF